MPITTDELRRRLSAWGVAPDAPIVALSRGGFSGAQIWRIDTPRESWCLRRWSPEHPGVAGLEQIHHVLRTLREQGFPRAPLPQATRSGSTFVQERALWELTDWLPGAGLDEAPSVRQGRAACETLAELHAATEILAEPVPGPSGTVQERLRMIEQLQTAPLLEWVERAGRVEQLDLKHWAGEVLMLFRRCVARVQQELDRHRDAPFPMQPCVRDTRIENFLFIGEEVSGVVDFGALRWDAVACDVARLLGSWTRPGTPDWEAGLAAYEARKPLGVGMDHLAATMYRSGALLSPFHWLRWLAVEDRQFEDLRAVRQRLEFCRRQLRQLSIDT